MSIGKAFSLYFGLDIVIPVPFQFTFVGDLVYPCRLKTIYCLTERYLSLVYAFLSVCFPDVSFVCSILPIGPLPFPLAPAAPLVLFSLNELAGSRSCKLKYMPHFCKQCVFVREIFF